MRFSLPRLESLLTRQGRLIPTALERWSGSSSSDEADTTLEESSGISTGSDSWRPSLPIGIVSDSVSVSVSGAAAVVAVVEAATAAGVSLSQQKVSRFHSLQLRFSSRRPFSRDAAHFEKTLAIG